MTALPRVVRAQARVLAARLPQAVAGGADDVHKSRVASRRLREALAVLADIPGADKLRKDIRRITRALGPVREIDVALETLDRQAGGGRFDRDAAGHARRSIEDERALRCDALQRARLLGLDVLTARAETVAAAAGQPGAAEADRQVLRRRLRLRSAALVDAIDECGALYAPERMHAVRIAIKKLRYAAEIAQASRVWPLAPSLRVLKRVQEDLGTLHDLQMLIGYIESALQPRRRSSLARALRQMLDALERECRTRNAELLPRLQKVRDVAGNVDALVTTAPLSARPRKMLKLSWPARARSISSVTPSRTSAARSGRTTRSGR